MKTRLFLILALAIIPFVDWLVPFPETQADLRLIGEPELCWRQPPRALASPVVESQANGVSTHAVSVGSKRCGLPDRDVTLGLVGVDPELRQPDAQPLTLPTAPQRAASDRSGRATYYHPSLAGGLMADGVTVYERDLSGVAAATSWPLGTVLYVRGPSGRGLSLVISDTGYLGRDHVDLSEADFIVLAGSLSPGVIPVEISQRD